MSFSGSAAAGVSTEDEEKKSLLPKGGPSEKPDERTEKQQYLEFAVYSLEVMLIIFACSIILATACTIVLEVNPLDMPLWVVFIWLWLGHIIIFGISVRVIQLLFRSLIPGFEKDKLTNKVLRTNEKRVALAQFTLFNLLWLHGISLMAIIFEVLLYLSIENVTPPYAPLIPIYIIASISIVNALVCR
jgi:small-conductance mechanosensitive channel